MTEIKALQLTDLPAMVSLHAVCFGAEKWNEAQLKGSLELNTTEGWGLYEKGELLAFILTQRALDETEVLTLCSDPGRRRQGLGSALLRHVMGRGVLFLEVAADNIAARGLYEKIGMTEFGIRPSYYKRGESLVDAVNYRYIPDTSKA